MKSTSFKNFYTDHSSGLVACCFLSQVSTEVKEADFLRRVEEQLVKCPHYFDLEFYRRACLEKDKTKTGKLPLEQVLNNN